MATPSRAKPHLWHRLNRRLAQIFVGREHHNVIHQIADAHRERYRMFEAALEFVRFEKVEGDVFEFGVFTGLSLALLAKAYHNGAQWDMPRSIAGFDSFGGLAPDTEGHAAWKEGDCAINHSWHPLCPEGAKVTPEITRELFRACGFPQPKLVVGLYSDTLRSEVQPGLAKAAVVHVDCDLYEAAREVLFGVEPALQDGSVVLFDDWFHYKADPNKGEARAFREFLAAHPAWEAIHYRSYATFCNAFILTRRSS